MFVRHKLNRERTPNNEATQGNETFNVPKEGGGIKKLRIVSHKLNRDCLQVICRLENRNL